MAVDGSTNGPKVILIGGAPMSGKTTLARLMAARLGCCCLSTDDLGEAVRAVTTPESHPHLHPLAGWDYREYYITRSEEDLAAVASRQHHALWPAVEAVIRAHAAWGAPAVIEGWALLPELSAPLRLPGVAPLWLLVGERTLEARLRADEAFCRGVR